MKKWNFQKVHNEKMFFQKAECLIKEVLFEKVECLASTYKSSSLKDKLPKMTVYIYKGVYFIIKSIL